MGQEEQFNLKSASLSQGHGTYGYYAHILSHVVWLHTNQFMAKFEIHMVDSIFMWEYFMVGQTVGFAKLLIPETWVTVRTKVVTSCGWRRAKFTECILFFLCS